MNSKVDDYITSQPNWSKELNLLNAKEVLGGMFSWQEGQEITMDLERNGEPVVIKTTLTKAFAKSEGLVENPEATEGQKSLRAAWLKG